MCPKKRSLRTGKKQNANIHVKQKVKKLLFIIQKASISNYSCHEIKCSCPKKLVWKSFLDTILQSRSLCRFLHVFGLHYRTNSCEKTALCTVYSTYLEGSRPRLTWSAMSVRQVFLLSPSKTMYFVSSILFLARFSLSALTASGFHSQAKTRSAWAWMR